MSREQHFTCMLFEQVGFGHGFQPAFFHLEQQQWITLNLSNQKQGVEATVMYEGQEKRVQVGVLIDRGVRFLPIEHTELTTSWPEPARRHFIEFFTWLPVQFVCIALTLTTMSRSPGLSRPSRPNADSQ